MSFDRILGRPQLRRSQVGMAFYDLERGGFVHERDADTLFAGASTTKVLTCASALHALGEDYRFETRVVRTGEIDAEGTLHGDLVLVASGDPNLSGRVNDKDGLDFCDFDHSLAAEGFDCGVVERDPLLAIDRLAEQIAGTGIRHVKGSVLVDLAAFPDAGREAGTNAAISAVCINDNFIDLTYTGGAAEGAPVRVGASPSLPYARFVNRLVTGPPHAKPDVRITDRIDDTGAHVVELDGSVPNNRMVRGNYAVPEPATFAASALTQALIHRGIRIDAAQRYPTISSYENAGVVASHRSPPLSEAVKIVLKVSQNLHAEMLPRVAGFDATRELIESLGLCDEGAFQGDGCGAAGTFTPRFMCRFLAGIRKMAYAKAFDRALPVLGRDGTLRDVQVKSRAAAARAIRAKTGTMGYLDRIDGGTFVTAKALAGYMTTARGCELAFALFATNVPVSIEDAGEILGEIAVAAYESL